jgi:uncharacterized protein (UPF0333 family)
MYQIKKKLGKRGQSTVEYVLLFAAVVAVLIVFLTPGTGVMSTSVNNAVASGTTELDSMTGNMIGSH